MLDTTPSAPAASRSPDRPSGARPIADIRTHPCLGCLAGDSPARRACAAARLTAEGHDPAPFISPSPARDRRAARKGQSR